MTDLQSKQRIIDKTTLEFRILQLLQMFQVCRDPETNDVVYINTNIRFDIKFIADKLIVKDTDDVLSALMVLNKYKEDDAPCPLVLRQGVNWIVSQHGVKYFTETIVNVWHNTNKSVAEHREEALMGAMEKFGRWVPTEMTTATLTSQNKPSARDSDDKIASIVDAKNKLARQAANELGVDFKDALDYFKNGTAKVCKGAINPHVALVSSFRSGRGICKKCEKIARFCR